MNNERYKELIEEVVPKEDKFKNGLIAFVIGGLVGLLGQIMVTILENNFDVETIAKLTKVSTDEVLKIKENLENNNS